MTIGRHYSCSVRTVTGKGKSVLLEQRNRKEALLLENGIATVLGELTIIQLEIFYIYIYFFIDSFIRLTRKVF